MEKKKVHRGDIWMCSFKSLLNIDPHPIVIIQNWKGNIKGSTYNAVMITSQQDTEGDYKASHYSLSKDKYKLDKDSVVCVEDIYTVRANDLMFKIDKLSNLDMISIDKLLATQLQLFDNKYNYLNDEDLEELFVEENFIVRYKKEEIIKLKCELYDILEKDKDYNRCLLRSYELIDMVKGNDEINSNDILHYIYHIQSKCYLKLKDWKNCLDKAKLSLKHMNRPTEFSYEYSLVLWDIARSYEELKQIDYSKRVYNSLEKYFESNNYEIMALTIKFNIAKLDNHINRMLELKEELTKLEANGVSYFTTKEYKESVLSDMITEINNLSGGV